MAKWNFYTSKEITPKGWIKKQLELQKDGLSGNLDKMWRDVKDSSWIGGDADGWERVPYWLDGFVPLAYLLRDEDMIARARKYIDAIVANQEESGWICPCPEEERKKYDTWAIILISKVLVVYYDCSGDERIPEVVCKVLKNFYDLLIEGKVDIFGWGKYRWFETFIAINFVKERFNPDWLPKLAKLVAEKGMDYNTVTKLWERPLNHWRFDTHIVNLAMMLKYEAVSCDILGTEYVDKAQELYDILYKYNGTPVELFTGDECLSGTSPIQGTELCAVVEQMYSYEILYAFTGDKKWAEKLEVIAYNALPATISEDMWTHQYVQMSNQIACITFPGRSLFRTNNHEAHLFGLEPHYGCCTSNFNQGWPKFALSAFMHSGDTIINSMLLPCDLCCDTAQISLDTEYPFVNTLKYKVCAKKDFTLEIRIPSFAKNVTVDGVACGEGNIVLSFKQGEQKEFCVAFDADVRIEKRPHGLNTVKCGSLVFSLPISYDKKMLEYERHGVERKFPYCDYELYPKSDWAYGIASDNAVIERRGISSCAFSESAPAAVVKVKVKKIDWGYEDGFDTVCAKIPESTKPCGEQTEIEFYPYGCAKLRMTELPIVE